MPVRFRRKDKDPLDPEFDPDLGDDIRAMTDGEFVRLQALIHKQAGIFLSPFKKALLTARLAKRLRSLGYDNFSDYYARVEEDAAERQQMIDCVATNETHFFREPQQFEYLETVIFPRWEEEEKEGKRSRRARIWSAACSTGEEPYTLAMVLLGHFHPLAWQVEVLGTDLSTKVLEAAMRGVWSIREHENIPLHHLKRYMLQGTGDQSGRMCAGTEIRNVIRFRQANLIDPATYASVGLFDAIFCRNVLIYFNAETRREVISRLFSHLLPGGTLFLGHAETLTGLPGVTEHVRQVAPNTYVWAEGEMPPIWKPQQRTGA